MQKKTYSHLSIEEREWIALGLAQNMGGFTREAQHH